MRFRGNAAPVAAEIVTSAKRPSAIVLYLAGVRLWIRRRP